MTDPYSIFYIPHRKQFSTAKKTAVRETMGKSSLGQPSRVTSYHVYLEALRTKGIANVVENSVAI